MLFTSITKKKETYILAQRALALFHQKERRIGKKHYTGNETLSKSTKEKRIPTAEAPCIPFTKRIKRMKSMGIRRVTSPCLILVMKVKISLLKNALVLASKFISALDRMSMKLQSKLGGCMSRDRRVGLYLAFSSAMLCSIII
eukprot:1145254-Pelagomonas_calceolata.AAC.1